MTATEKNLLALIDSSTDNVVLLDPEYTVLCFNQTIRETLYGYFHKNIAVGDDYRDFVVESNMALFLEFFDRAISGQQVRVDNETIGEDFSIWFHYILNPVYSADGNEVIAVTLTARDITESKKAEEALKTMAARMSAVLEHASEAVVLLSADQKVILANSKGVARVNQHFRTALEPGSSFDDLIPDYLQEKFKQAFEVALNGETTIAEEQIKSGNGSFWIRATLNPVYNDNQQLIGVSLFVRNTNQEKQYLENLEKSDERFRKIIASATNPIIILSDTLTITMVNEETSNVFGYEPDELIGKSIDMLVPQRFLTNHRKLQKDYLKEPRSIRMGMNRLTPAIQKSGEEIVIEASLNTFEFDGKTNVLLMIQEVTQRVKAAQELERLNFNLNLLNQVNDCILNSRSVAELLDKVCETIVSSNRYKLAWICRKDQKSGTNHLKSIAAKGELNYLNELNILIGNLRHSKGPTITSLRYGKTVVTNNLELSDDFLPWRDTAKKYGIVASIVLPLKLEKGETGCLNIYSSVPDVFDTQQIEILERLSSNVSMAVYNLGLNREKDALSYSLNERVKEQKTLYQVLYALQKEDSSAEETLQAVANLLPAGLQYPQYCSAGIQFDNHIFRSSNPTESSLHLSASFVTARGKKGSVHVYYSEDSGLENPDFLPEEYQLINTIAELLTIYINRLDLYRELKESEENLNVVFQNSDVGHLLLDADLNIKAFNNLFQTRYEQVSGFSIKTGQNFKKYILPEKQSDILYGIEKVIQSKEPVSYDTTYEYNGSKQHFRVGIFPIFQAGLITGFSYSVIDLTDSFKLEQERKEMMSDLIRKNHGLKEFAHIVSHNIRAPLASILGLTSVFEEALSEEDKLYSIRALKASAESLDHVLRDLKNLLYSANAGNQADEVKSAFRLTDSFETARQQLAVEGKKTNFRTYLAIPDNLTITSVRSHFDMIFYHLLDNSIKFQRPEAELRIDLIARKKENQLEIEYSDNACGFDIEKARDKLFRLYQKYRYDMPGRGIGLYTIKTLLDSMNANIEVYSEPGAGTQFGIVIPLN